MKITSSILSITLFFCLLSCLYGCIQGATISHNIPLNNRAAIVNKIKTLAQADTVTFRANEEKDRNDQLLSTVLLIEITNGSTPAQTDRQISRQIVLLTKNDLEQPMKFDTYKVNYLPKGENGETGKSPVTTVSFLPGEL